MEAMPSHTCLFSSSPKLWAYLRSALVLILLLVVLLILPAVLVLLLVLVAVLILLVLILLVLILLVLISVFHDRTPPDVHFCGIPRS